MLCRRNTQIGGRFLPAQARLEGVESMGSTMDRSEHGVQAWAVGSLDNAAHSRGAARRHGFSQCPAGAATSVGTDGRQSRGRARRHVPQFCLAALLLLPGLSHAITLANASSATVLECGNLRSMITQLGATTDHCVFAANTLFSRAEGSVRTVLGERPLASASAAYVGEVNRYIPGVIASAQLTYEVRLAELASPPVGLTHVPVTVQVRGQVVRESQRAGTPVAPVAIGSAWVTVRSDPSIPWANADVVLESAVRTPQAPWQDKPDFDKFVSISLMPGHTYTVQLVAGCRLSGSTSRVSFASSSSCSAEADPVFALDQTALDQQFGAARFSLADFYGFEYSAGVLSPVPEPGTSALLLLGVAGLAAVARRPRA